MQDLCQASELAPSTYIFGGFQVADDASRQVAADVWQALKDDGRSILLNHPLEFLRRQELLEALYLAGINRFRSYRLSELKDATPSYPVFLRSEHLHTGSLSGLLRDRAELEAAASRILKRERRSELLAVEYMAVDDGQGIFRKYSATKVGDRIVPEQLSYSAHWNVKRYPKGLDPSLDNPLTIQILEEETRYLTEFPDGDQLEKVFDIARIDCGRVDYAKVDGQVCVWEINTAPYYGLPGGYRPDWMWRLRERREPGKQHFNRLFSDALAEIDSPPVKAAVRLELDPTLVATASSVDRASTSTHRRTERVRELKQQVKRLPGAANLLAFYRRLTQ